MSGASVSAASGLQRPRRRPGENRAGLLAAGTVEFGVLGYAAAQTGAIARRAGVSQPNVYANFTSKRELFLACVSELHAAVSREALGGPEEAIAATPLSFTDEQSLLLYQSIAALGDPQIASELRPLIVELRAALGEGEFERTILRAVNRMAVLD